MTSPGSSSSPAATDGVLKLHPATEGATSLAGCRHAHAFLTWTRNQDYIEVSLQVFFLGRARYRAILPSDIALPYTPEPFPRPRLCFVSSSPSTRFIEKRVLLIADYKIVSLAPRATMAPPVTHSRKGRIVKSLQPSSSFSSAQLPSDGDSNGKLLLLTPRPLG